MAATTYYRGGTNLNPKPREMRLDPATGLVLPARGISVYDRPDKLDRFGGAYEVCSLRQELLIIQTGRDPYHHEIIPAWPMTLQEYENALRKIKLVPVSP